MFKSLVVIAVVVVILIAAAWLKLRGPDIPYEQVEAKYRDDASRFIDLPGNFRVHYQEYGDPASPLLVLLHGFGDSYTSWEGWSAQLKDRFHVISLDFPGHGLTRAPVGYQLTGPALADFVDLFAGALALPKFAVAGNSMGGGAAWQLAVRHPERINALILVDAAGWPAEKPPTKIPLAFRILQYRAGRALLRNIDNSPLIEEGLKTDVYDKSLITPQFVARWAEFQRAPGHRAILMDISIGAQASAGAAILSHIQVPTLVVNGENDVLVEPSSARKFAAAIPGARLILYPQVGHLPQIEIPQRSAEDLAAFLLTQLPASQSPAASKPPVPAVPPAPVSSAHAKRLSG
ncbi:MAG: alpha/beta hydrolase [Steroidobacteraceae bacterium]